VYRAIAVGGTIAAVLIGAFALGASQHGLRMASEQVEKSLLLRHQGMKPAHHGRNSISPESAFSGGTLIVCRPVADQAQTPCGDNGKTRQLPGRRGGHSQESPFSPFQN